MLILCCYCCCCRCQCADAKANAEHNVPKYLSHSHCIVIIWLQVVGQSANGQARNEIRVHCAFSKIFEIFENGKNETEPENGVGLQSALPQRKRFVFLFEKMFLLFIHLSTWTNSFLTFYRFIVMPIAFMILLIQQCWTHSQYLNGMG